MHDESPDALGARRDLVVRDPRLAEATLQRGAFRPELQNVRGLCHGDGCACHGDYLYQHGHGHVNSLMIDWRAVGILVRRHREGVKQSQKKYGQALDLDQSQMSNLELGKFRDPDDLIVQRLRQRIGPLPTVHDEPAKTLEVILEERLKGIETTMERLVYLLEQQEKILLKLGQLTAAPSKR